MIKAIIFDCFGVLINDAFEAIVNEFRLTHPKEADEIVRLVSLAGKGLIDAQVARSAEAKLLGLTSDEYINKIRTGEVKNLQLLEYIKELKKNYKVGLLSNVLKGGLEVRFTPDELSIFDTVVASSDVGFAKPEAQAYEITASRLGVRLEECIMIDDREDYCLGATGVGMKAIQYQSFDQMKADLEAIIHPRTI